MFHIRYVTEQDGAFWRTIDGGLSESEFCLKIRDKRGYVISDGDKPIGVMRYNLFWDHIPFLTLIHIADEYCGKGFGTQSMIHWENEMRGLGYDMLMTSTQVDERGQFFYRKLGYVDMGALFFDDQAQELVMMKTL
jgi:Acetyltransferase (GNAT) family.